MKGWVGGVGFTPQFPFVSLNVGYQDATETTTVTRETIIPEEKIVEDINVKSQIVTREDALIATAKKVQELGELISKYLSEVDTIILAAVLFGTFTKENAIVIYVDAFEEYFQQLINRWSFWTSVNIVKCIYFIHFEIHNFSSTV